MVFCVIYGTACYIHGGLQVALFDPDGPGTSLTETVRGALADDFIVHALVSLGVVQLVFLVERLVRTRLEPETINVILGDVMPRVVVTHTMILGGAFLFIALDDPIAGIIAMVLAKMTVDLTAFWRLAGTKPEPARTSAGPAHTPLHDPELEAQFNEPVLEVSGRRHRFESFMELNRSPAFTRYRHLLRLAGEEEKLARVERYVAQRAAEEFRGRGRGRW